MSFGKILKNLRMSRNITQVELAQFLNIGRATIAGYETKNKQPDHDKLVAIADFFKVTIDYLLERSPEPNGAGDIEQIFTKLNYVNQIKAKERMLTLLEEQEPPKSK